MSTTQQPSLALFDAATPDGIPADVWLLFVQEADKVRGMGRSHYSARTIAEVIRHHRIISSRSSGFVLNNNHVPVMSRRYMELRRCPGFFETRERQPA